jgi:hypothetical protein
MTITPPILLGIARRIEYAKRKYHSGWICSGVDIGLAGIKLSGSMNRNGLVSDVLINSLINIDVVTKSLKVNRGWKGSLSLDKASPRGLLDPFSCRVIRWIVTRRAIRNGIVKWRVKNRFKVGDEMANPPQIVIMIFSPTTGMVVIRLVMTVAAQKDIWPHGKIYPRKAVIMDIR